MSNQHGARNHPLGTQARPDGCAAPLLRSLCALLVPLALLLSGCLGSKSDHVEDGQGGPAKRGLHLVEDGPGAEAKRQQQMRESEEEPTVDFGDALCFWKWDLFNRVSAPPPPADSLVLCGDKLEPQKQLVPGTPEADLAGARELFRRGEYAGAEKLYHRIADNTKNAVAIAEEARYYEAECLYLQRKYPKAGDTYVKLLNDFPSTPYREQAIQRMYDIANFWLEDTREEMRQTLAKRKGERWVVWPHFVQFEKTKPLLDEEGRAMSLLEHVRFNDMQGPLADDALFLMGAVQFFNEDYREADHYFSQIVEMHPNSPLAPEACRLAILAKNQSTGGPDYDGRKAAEARALVDTALRSYPELAAKREEFLTNQLKGITLQQAEKDYKMAEFYRRTGHPGSAYFYYEIVCRRYPGTRFAQMAEERKQALDPKLRKEQEQAPSGAPVAPGVVPEAPLVRPPEQVPPNPLPGGLR